MLYTYAGISWTSWISGKGSQMCVRVFVCVCGYACMGERGRELRRRDRGMMRKEEGSRTEGERRSDGPLLCSVPLLPFFHGPVSLLCRLRSLWQPASHCAVHFLPTNSCPHRTCLPVLLSSDRWGHFISVVPLMQQVINYLGGSVGSHFLIAYLLSSHLFVS